MEDRTRNITEQNYQKKGNLATAAIMGLLPTPTAQDFKRRGSNSRQQGLSNTENWINLLPTPTAREYKGGRHPDTLRAAGRLPSNTLGDTINHLTGRVSRLSPLFVMEMMGLPWHWTALPSRWRSESIKAGGNAIVPQVALRIFRTIQKLHIRFQMQRP